MKLKTSVKMSDENIKFWKKCNLNLTLTYKIKQFEFTPSDLQEYIVKYFKLDNNRYIELIDLIIKMEKNNGIK